MSALVAKEGHRVIAVDSSPNRIAFAQEAWLQIDFRVGSYFDHLGGPYDVVLALGLLESVYEPELGLERMAKLLRYGGHLILSTSASGYLENLALTLAGKRGSAPVFTRRRLRSMLVKSGFGHVIFRTVGLWRATLVRAER